MHDLKKEQGDLIIRGLKEYRRLRARTWDSIDDIFDQATQEAVAIQQEACESKRGRVLVFEDRASVKPGGRLNPLTLV